MEKNIKRFSIALIIATAVFILDFLIGTKLAEGQKLTVLIQITVYVVYALMVVEPILFIIVVTMSMIVLLRSSMRRQTAGIKQSAKFPTWWVVGAVLSFIGFYLLTEILLGAAG